MAYVEMAYVEMAYIVMATGFGDNVQDERGVATLVCTRMKKQKWRFTLRPYFVDVYTHHIFCACGCACKVVCGHVFGLVFRHLYG